MATTGIGVAKKHFSAGPKKRPGRAAGRNGHNHGPTGGLHIESRFCPTDVADPFDTVQWELRTRRDQGRERRSAVRADRLRSPVVLDAAGHQRRLSASTSTAKSARPSANTASASSSTASPARSPTGASKTATSPRAEDGERFYRELTWLCLHQHGAFNSPVWFNVGLFHQYGVKGAQVQLALGSRDRRRRAAGEPLRVSARLGLLHPERRRQHGRHHGARPQRGHALQVRLAAPAPTSRRSARIARSSPAAASPRARCRSCGSTTRSPRS